MLGCFLYMSELINFIKKNWRCTVACQMWNVGVSEVSTSLDPQLGTVVIVT